MSSHYCTGIIHDHGKKFWGSPLGPPLADPVPPEVLERFPDVIADWDNCSACGEAVCGKVARFKIQSMNGEELVWLCAEHWDAFAESDLPVWHQCLG